MTVPSLEKANRLSLIHKHTEKHLIVTTSNGSTVSSGAGAGDWPADASDLRFRIMPDGQRPRCRVPLAGVPQIAPLT